MTLPSPAVPRDIGRVLDAALSRDPDQLALVGRDRRLTYAQLDAEADAAACALASLGIRPGDRVAASLPNETAVVVAFHGAMRLGAMWVGLNQLLPAREKAALLADCEASLFLCDTASAGNLAAVDDSPPWLHHLQVVPAHGSDEWERRVAGHRGTAWKGPEVDPEAPAAIAYTSGTTGGPKGVLHSQAGLLAPGAALAATRAYGPDTVKGDCLAFTILNLLVLSTLLCSQAQATCVVMDGRDAPGIARWIRDERITVWNGVPTMLYDLVHDDSVTPEDLSSLEDVWSGGAPCAEELRLAFSEKFGHRVHTTYGLTEAPTVVTIEDRAEPSPPGSSGRVLPHLAVRITADDGTEIPAGETGEICLAPPASPSWAPHHRQLLGYWRQPERSAEVRAGGMVHTGDLGCVDSAGNLYVKDRKQLLILRGGANVYPAEVEAVLVALPHVRGCAVVGVPDERLGERVVAVLEVDPSFSVPGSEDGGVQAALRRHCAQHLARYKLPDRFVLRDELPRNAMGKIRRDLAAHLATELAT